MKNLLILLAFLGACNEPCELLPRQNYRMALIDRDPESFFCFTQVPDIDFTNDVTLADSVVQGCQVTIDRMCGETNMTIVCPDLGVNVACDFHGNVGTCTNDLKFLVCHYDAWLDPVSP